MEAKISKLSRTPVINFDEAAVVGIPMVTANHSLAARPAAEPPLARGYSSAPKKLNRACAPLALSPLGGNQLSP